MQTAQGSLTMVGLNTETPRVFWNGNEVLGVTHIRVDCDADEQRVKLKVSSMVDALYAELVAANITVKRGG